METDFRDTNHGFETAANDAAAALEQFPGVE